MIEIKKATILELEYLVPLFDAYRVFYRKPTNKIAAKEFLKSRIENQESVVYIA